MNNLRSLCIRRMDRVLNTRIRESCGVMKGVDEKIGGVRRWFGHVERIENGKIHRDYM